MRDEFLTAGAAEAEKAYALQHEKIMVRQEVYDEIIRQLRQNAVAKINQMSYADRRALVDRVTRECIAKTIAPDPSDVAAVIRAERARRKAENYAKRQPRGKA